MEVPRRFASAGGSEAYADFRSMRDSHYELFKSNPEYQQYLRIMFERVARVFELPDESGFRWGLMSTDVPGSRVAETDEDQLTIRRSIKRSSEQEDGQTKLFYRLGIEYVAAQRTLFGHYLMFAKLESGFVGVAQGSYYSSEPAPWLEGSLTRQDELTRLELYRMSQELTCLQQQLEEQAPAG